MLVNQIKLFDVTICKLHNEELANRLLPVCDYFTSKTDTNLLGTYNYPSTLQNSRLGDEVNKHPIVQEAFRYIFEHIREIASRSHVYEKIDNVIPYGFFSSMNNGAYLKKHRHIDCNYSGCMYLDIGQGAPGITFFDPNPHSTNIYRIPSSELKPGTILIWPKWLEHEVDQKLNDDPRKVFTFNV